jgi:hypothetical protein
MATASEYDGEVQMFVEPRREVDLAHLRFLRWLAERGSLEHGPAGRSYGVYALSEAVLRKGAAASGGAVAPRAEGSLP